MWNFTIIHSLQSALLELHDLSLNLYKLKVAINIIIRTLWCILACFIVSFSLKCLMYEA